MTEYISAVATVQERKEDIESGTEGPVRMSIVGRKFAGLIHVKISTKPDSHYSQRKMRSFFMLLFLYSANAFLMFFGSFPHCCSGVDPI